MNVQSGIADYHLDAAAALYWQAFGPKLGKVLGPDDKAIRFIRRVIDPAFGLSVTDGESLLGVAGFKTYEGALVGGTFRDVASVYGWFGAAWRVAVLALLERDVENDRFLMDGIFVAAQARGFGVGTALLQDIYAQGHKRGYAEVRLDVIDTNPRAKALYAREGFVEVKTDHLGPLGWIFGFKSATTMVRPLP